MIQFLQVPAASAGVLAAKNMPCETQGPPCTICHSCSAALLNSKNPGLAVFEVQLDFC
jgi:hypothetical protein